MLAYQRYGRGKALALTVQDTWLWRMHSKVAIGDPTFHTFWQRLTRWMVDGVPDRVMATATPDRAAEGRADHAHGRGDGSEFHGVNDGQVTAHVTAPSGRVEDVPMEWTVKRDGEYRARFTADEDGIYKLQVGGTRAGRDLGSGSTDLRVAPSDAEYFDAGMRAPLLERLSHETEGRFFRAGDTSKLVDAITYSGRGITVVDERDLWDMPAVLFALLGLMAVEWAYRRSKGLA